jgi:hypothetical protein
VTFSEAIQTGVPVTSAVSEIDGGSTDDISVTGITNGNIDTGSDYISSNKTATFASSTVSQSVDKKTITVTVAGSCTGAGSGCGKLAAGAAGPVAYVPAATLLDAAFNGAVANGVTPTFTIRLF